MEMAFSSHDNDRITHYFRDINRDLDRFHQLINAIRESTEKLQNIGGDARTTTEEILGSLLQELVEALEARYAFIALQVVDAEGHATLEIVRIVAHPQEETEIPPQTTLEPIGRLKKVIETGVPVVIAPSQYLQANVIQGLESFGTRSAILLRVKTLESSFLVAICETRHPEERSFIASDKITAQHILELAAVGIRANERQRRDFQYIREIFGPAEGNRQYRGRLDHIVSRARSAFDAEAVSLMLWRRAETELRVAAYSGLSPGYCDSQHILRDVAFNQLNQKSLRAGEYRPFVIEDLQKTPLGELSLIVDEDIRSVLCAPLIVKEVDGQAPGNFIGVLNIYSKGRQRGFAPVERDFAQLFAEQSAIAVQASRLLDRQRQQQAAIQEISEFAAHGDAALVWETISRNAATLTSASYATLVRLRRDGLRILAPSGTWYAGDINRWIPQPWTLPYSDGSMIGRVIGNSREAYLPDVAAEPEQFHNVMHPDLPTVAVKSAYCVPLTIDEQAIGALFIASDREGAFTPHDRDALKLIAPHAAIALRSIDLKEIDTKAIEFQTNIADIMDPKDQAKQIVANLNDSGYDVSGCFLVLIDRQTRTLDFLYAKEVGTGVGAEENVARYTGATLGACPGVIEWVVDNDSSLLVRDFDIDDDRYRQIDRACRSGIRSCLAVPMRVNGRIIGVLGLRSYRRKNAFDERDRELLEKLAPHIAIVLTNSQRYSEQARGLRAVSQYQQELSLLDTSKPYAIVEQEIENIYEYARKTIKSVGMLTDHMFIALYDAFTQSIEYPLVYEDNRRIDANESQSPTYRNRQLGEHQDFTEWLIRSPDRQPLLFENRRQMEQWVRDKYEASNLQIQVPSRSKSWLAAPMVATNEKLVGVIGLRSFQHESVFSQSHKELMQILANQAAIAIENARLYEESKNTTAVALMGAWGADIVHDVHRESQNIQWSMLRLKGLLEKTSPTEDVQLLLDSIQSSAKELTLPALPTEMGEPDQIIDIRKAPYLQRILRQEIEHQANRSERITVSSVFAEDDVRVAMDEQWIRRLLRHLIKNASRHLESTRGQGTITVSAHRENGQAKVLVEDNGMGVREAIQPMLFQVPTPHADERQDRHQGRGLMLVRFVASIHGGNADLEWSIPQTGSCFSFTVPIVEQGSAEPNMGADNVR